MATSEAGGPAPGAPVGTRTSRHTPPGAACHMPDGDPRTKDTLVSVEMVPAGTAAPSSAGSEVLLGRPQRGPVLPSGVPSDPATSGPVSCCGANAPHADTRNGACSSRGPRPAWAQPHSEDRRDGMAAVRQGFFMGTPRGVLPSLFLPRPPPRSSPQVLACPAARTGPVLDPLRPWRTQPRPGERGGHPVPVLPTPPSAEDLGEVTALPGAAVSLLMGGGTERSSLPCFSARPAETSATL